MIWNPSEGFDLGFMQLRYYSLMFVVAFGLGWFVMKKIYDREGLSVDKLDKLFIYTVLATLIGARLGHVFFYDWDYFKTMRMKEKIKLQNARVLSKSNRWKSYRNTR